MAALKEGPGSHPDQREREAWLRGGFEVGHVWEGDLAARRDFPSSAQASVAWPLPFLTADVVHELPQMDPAVRAVGLISSGVRAIKASTPPAEQLLFGPPLLDTETEANGY